MIYLSQGITLTRNTPLDLRQGVYNTVAEAKAAIPLNRRYLGLTVIVNQGAEIKEWWWKFGIADNNLIEKEVDSPQSQYTVVNISSSGLLDLSSYYNTHTFYINCQADNIEINEIKLADNKDVILIFVSNQVRVVTLKHTAKLNCLGIDNDFHTNEENWWIGRRDRVDTTEVRQINSHSTKPVMSEGDPTLDSTVQFVEHLPAMGEDGVLYVVTSSSPNPSFRWNGSTYINVDLHQTSLRAITVRTVINIPTGVGGGVIGTIHIPRTINGVTLQVANLILMTGQTSTTRNGLYVVSSIIEFGTIAVIERSTQYNISTLKGLIVQVFEGNNLKDSLWILPVHNNINLNHTYYKQGSVLPSINNISIVPQMIYNPTLPTGSQGSIMYWNNGVWVVTPTAPRNSILGVGSIIPQGSWIPDIPRWVTGDAGDSLLMGATGPYFGKPSGQYQVKNISDSDFTFLGNLFLGSLPVRKTVIPGAENAIYKHVNTLSGVLVYSFNPAAQGYYKTLTIKNNHTSSIVIWFAGFNTSNNITEIGTVDSKKIKWANGSALSMLGSGETAVIYFSLQGTNKSDVIASYIKVKSIEEMEAEI